MSAARQSPWRFTEFRADGWPLCPCCSEDELYSLANPATVETVIGCYRCAWKPGAGKWRVGTLALKAYADA